MRTVHQKIHHHLKLQQHRHTGRLLHHKHTSYRGLALVFVFAGIAMIGVTIAGRVAADSLIAVQAMVQPPVPTVAPIIAQPLDGAKLTSNTVLVAGSCPIISPQVIVQVLIDGTSAGSAICDSNNDFVLPATLTTGTHVVTAKTYTITSRPGPVTSPIHITVPNGTQAKATTTMTLTDDAPLSYVGDDKTATWTGTITGGTPPYNVHIDWNDGRQDTTTNTGGKQSFEHTYANLASYNPLITVADSAGHTASKQFAVGAYTLASARLSPSTYNAPPVTLNTLLGLYGMLVTTVSISGIIWLEAKHTAGQEVAL